MMNKMTPAVIAENVSLTLNSRAGPVEILKSVSLTVSPGESVGVVGRSGSGKSSLLSVLAGLEQVTAGHISVLGRNIDAMDEDALAAFRLESVGFIFQAFHLIPTMTALENTALPLELAGAPEAAAQARKMLEDVGLGARLDHYPDQLSGGEQQRVAIGRALVGRPPVLFADEPTGNLDAGAAGIVIDLLFALREKARAALILVTHDPALAARCDRIETMEDGRLVVSPLSAAAE